MAEGFAQQMLILGLPAHSMFRRVDGAGCQKGAIQPGDVFLGLGLTAMTPGVSVMLKMARGGEGKNRRHRGVAGASPGSRRGARPGLAPVRTTEDIPSWTALAGMLNGLMQTVAIAQG